MKKFLIIILLALLLWATFFVLSKKNATITPKVCDLVNNPDLYINKSIKVEAIVKFIGKNYYSQEGNFFLEDDNCKMQVFSRSPTTVANCPPNIKNCHTPETMSKYLNKKLKLSWIFKKLSQKKYVNKEFIVDTYYVITDVRDVLISE